MYCNIRCNIVDCIIIQVYKRTGNEMTYREKMVKEIMANLAAFIYEEDLLIGDEICQSQTKDHKGCPYGEKHTKEECLKCMDEFLDMEVQ